MAGRVQLYVYDLSRGMAKAMSLGLTGKQIDGIWYVATHLTPDPRVPS